MAIYMTASFKAKPGSVEKCQAAIREFISQIKKNEPGTRVYQSMQDKEDQTEFLHYFVFEDEEAEAYHRATEWVQAFTEVLYPELVGDVTFKQYHLLASTKE